MSAAFSRRLLSGAAGPSMPWMDASLPPDQRADLVVRAATPQELRGLIVGSMLFFLPAKQKPAGVIAGAGYLPGIARLGISPITESDASLGVANMGGVIRAGDVATAMPSSLGVAASFDPDVAREGGAMIGAEARPRLQRHAGRRRQPRPRSARRPQLRLCR